MALTTYHNTPYSIHKFISWQWVEVNVNQQTYIRLEVTEKNSALRQLNKTQKPKRDEGDQKTQSKKEEDKNKEKKGKGTTKEKGESRKRKEEENREIQDGEP